MRPFVWFVSQLRGVAHDRPVRLADVQGNKRKVGCGRDGVCMSRFGRIRRPEGSPLRHCRVGCGAQAGVVGGGRWPMHTGLLEGTNNRIKAIKRIAYGYRDDTCFFLKIRAVLPGVGR